MSKELEALRRVVSEIDKYKLYGIGDENWLGIQDVLKDISTIENALQQAQKQEKFIQKLKYNLISGRFEDKLEHTNKDGSSEDNMYNKGLYDMVNDIESYVLQEIKENRK